MNIQPVKLTSAIMEMLEEYGNEITSVMGDVANEVGDDVVKKLKAEKKFSSDPDNRYKSTGKYARGWTNENTSGKGGTYVSRTVYNSGRHGNLAHLIENGHPILTSKGQVKWDSPAYTHIKPIEEQAQEDFERKLIERIGKT